MEKRLRWEDLAIGDRTGPLRYTITDEIIDAFAEATDDLGEWHMVDSPYGGRIAHAILNITDYSLMLFQSHGSHTGLHSRQETELFYPLKASDEITARGEIVELFQRRGYDYYALRYEAVNQVGQLVTRHKLTTTVDPDGPPPPMAGGTGTSKAKAVKTEPAAVPTGPELPSISRPFNREIMALFANQTGLRVGRGEHTVNTHTDVEVARSVGLPDVVAQSTHFYSWYSEMMLKFLGEGWLCGGRIEAKFFGMVFPGNVVTVSGRVAGVRKDGPDERVTVELAATTQDGPVSVATASGLVGRRIPEPGWPIGQVVGLP